MLIQRAFYVIIITMREFQLKNGILVGYKPNPNTPRIALAFNVAINKEEQIAGTHSLLCRLLQQGTTTYSSEELANILDENAIEFSTEMKQDYLSFRFVCLNEDFSLALKILEDVVKNSTFEEFDKEVQKIKGEYSAELDSNKSKVSDEFIKTVYSEHMYGNTYTRILDNIDKVTQQMVVDLYKEILLTGNKVVSVVGDNSIDNLDKILNETLATLENPPAEVNMIPVPVLAEQKVSEIIKDDAQQAQILQGWLVPTVESEEYPAIAVMNTILGSSGLSSRLFLELRDKKGLAYTVRSAYRSFGKSALFHIYIGTEPKNIEVSLQGFKEEIDKIKSIPVELEELESAKNNLFGKQQFISETNSQQANLAGHYAILGLGFDFQDSVTEKIKSVTSQDIMDVANKYLDDKYVLTMIKP